MELSVSQRIRSYLDVRHISLNALAKSLEMNQSTILRQIKGEQTLANMVVEKFLATYPEVSAEWLLRGKGDMLLSDEQEEKEEAPVVEDYWKAKYEAVKECYDLLVGSMTQATAKRNVG